MGERDIPEEERLRADLFHWRISYKDTRGEREIELLSTSGRLGRVVQLPGGRNIRIDVHPVRPPRRGGVTELRGHQI